MSTLLVLALSVRAGTTFPDGTLQWRIPLRANRKLERHFSLVHGAQSMRSGGHYAHREVQG